MNRARENKEPRLTVELEALATRPVAVDGAVAAATAPPEPLSRRRAAGARRRRRRLRRRPAQLVRLLPATSRGRVPALEGRPEQPVHLAPALGRRRGRVGLDLQRRQRRRLGIVARRHEHSSMVVRGKWREDGDRIGDRIAERGDALVSIYTKRKWKGDIRKALGREVREYI